MQGSEVLSKQLLLYYGFEVSSEVVYQEILSCEVGYFGKSVKLLREFPG
jgi:hypothetical protein